LEQRFLGGQGRAGSKDERAYRDKKNRGSKTIVSTIETGIREGGYRNW